MYGHTVTAWVRETFRRGVERVDPTTVQMVGRTPDSSAVSGVLKLRRRIRPDRTMSFRIHGTHVYVLDWFPAESQDRAVMHYENSLDVAVTSLQAHLRMGHVLTPIDAPRGVIDGPRDVASEDGPDSGSD